jgi:hypothetical protein
MPYLPSASRCWTLRLRSALLPALLGLAAVIGLASDAGAWGEQGHRAVAEVAGTMLTPKARTAVVALLGNDDLAAAAVWLDEVRAAALGKGPLVGDEEARVFNERHPDSGEWHFINLPLGPGASLSDPAFASRHNVVERIPECIRVLEAPPGTKLSMTKAQALKALIHLVGDLHQPLHVGSGYYAFTRDGRAILVTSPARARGRPSDRGGNLLRWGKEQGETLHVDWDVTIARRIADSPDAGALAARIKSEIPTVSPLTPGDYRAEWARRWAAESLRAAGSAYRDVVFGTAVRDPQRRLEFIEIQLLPERDGYLEKNAPLATLQLTKAAVHLAALLNRITWP